MLSSNRKQKPKIAITTSDTGNKTAVLALKLAVRLAGGRPVVISPSNPRNSVDDLQGFILSGGADIDPKLYGQEGDGRLMYDFERDHMEYNCAAMALSRGIPILGICRGAQMLNVIGGGSLHQNLSEAYGGFLPTSSLLAKVAERRSIKLADNGTIPAVFCWKDKLWVNSIHKQGIDKVADGYRAVAFDELGIIQAIESKDPLHFAVGVQWHPEFMLYSSQQRQLFSTFIDACASPSPTQSFEPAVSQV